WLYRTISATRRVLWNITETTRSDPRRIVYPESEDDNILRAAQRVLEAHIAQPILLGHADHILKHAENLGLSLEGATIVDPRESEKLEEYVEAYWQKRQRKNVTRHDAWKEMRRSRTTFGLIMVDQGDADRLVADMR